jgi:hypothetical protein
MMAAAPDELAADLQEVYGVDIEAAQAGAHSASHVAALAAGLGPSSRVAAAADPDARWTLADVLLAVIANDLRLWIWVQSDPRRRGPKPHPIGPSWMADAGRTRRAEAAVMTRDALMRELTKERREVQ